MQPACIRLLPQPTARTFPKTTSKALRQQRCVLITHHAWHRPRFHPRRHFSTERKSPPEQRQHPSSNSTWKRIGVLVGLAVAGKIAWDRSQWFFQNEEGAVSRTAFQTYTLLKKDPVSSTASIFHLQPTIPSTIRLVEEDLKQGIINLEFKQPQIQVVRAYTPLPNTEPTNSLRFLIRQEPNGEVSSWLHRLPLGSRIEMRGPNCEFVMPQHTQRVLFLAGGTGIATAIQAAHSLLQQSQTPGTGGSTAGAGKQIHILWASRRQEDCVGAISDLRTPSFLRRVWSAVIFQDPYAALGNTSLDTAGAAPKKGLIVHELERLKATYPGQVFVSYFVDEHSTFITEDSIRRTLKAIAGPPSKDKSSMSGLRRSDNSPPTGTQILISGPDGFIAALAGPKIWVQGRQEQGPVGGVLGKVLRDGNANDIGRISVYKV